MDERERPETGDQESRRLHALVRGRVQAVGFRQFVWSRAARLGLTGWVRNVEDGRSVEVEAEGPRADLEKLLGHLHEGPFGARVEDVQASWSGEPQGHATFEIRF